VIRDLEEEPKLRKRPVETLVVALLDRGSSLLCHCESQEEQQSFESTCRKPLPSQTSNGNPLLSNFTDKFPEEQLLLF
jgi:hypothetical protein